MRHYGYNAARPSDHALGGTSSVSQYKEAVKFAVLAYANVNRLANNIPAASGAQRFAVMGRAVLPPRLAKVDAVFSNHNPK
jgi:anhydro-N-acetylmuramic acid kinase